MDFMKGKAGSKKDQRQMLCEELAGAAKRVSQFASSVAPSPLAS